MIDWNRIRELRDDLGADALDEVTGLFAAEMDETLAALDPALPGEELARRLHALKGGALNLGLVTLARRCAEAEVKAAAGQGTAAPVAELRALYDASLTALAAGPGAVAAPVPPAGGV